MAWAFNLKFTTITHELELSGQMLKTGKQRLELANCRQKDSPTQLGASFGEGMYESVGDVCANQTQKDTAKERAERVRPLSLHLILQLKPVLVSFRMEQRTLSTRRSQRNCFPSPLNSHCWSPESWKQIAFLPVQEVRGSLHVL